MMPISLTELVRLLEQRNHIFSADPTVITEHLRQNHQDNLSKLHRRAELIDRHHELADRLNRHQRRIQWLLYMAAAVWFITGFMGTYGLMQQSALNFFVVLMGILGMNTIMLFIWLINVCFRRQTQSITIPFLYGKHSDAVGQAIAQLDADTMFRPHTMWRRSVVMHRLTLMGLMGMFVAALLLLLVRQYRFTWESTLLSNQTMTHAIAYLAWLPEKLGFDVPTASAILASRNHLDETNAATWGSLLLGSLLCYGILPRLLAWGVSVWQTHRHQPELNLQLPYYQNIIQRWQRKIVDSDQDYSPDPIRQSPAITLQAASQHWAVAVDMLPQNNPQWYQDVLGQEWLNQNVVASRDEWVHLAQTAAAQPVQLLVAIRAAQTPDRGTIRRLASLGTNVIVWLWTDSTSDSSTQERLQQWYDVCEQYGWTWVKCNNVKSL